eukprot:357516-Chlamydomonas_euryale.AAC.15
MSALCALTGIAWQLCTPKLTRACCACRKTCHAHDVATVMDMVPRDSSWFGFYNGTALVPLEQQRLYTEDWIGLRKLDESGRLVRASIEGRHMHFSQEWFEEHVLWKYLAGQGFRQRLPASA